MIVIKSKQKEWSQACRRKCQELCHLPDQGGPKKVGLRRWSSHAAEEGVVWFVLVISRSIVVVVVVVVVVIVAIGEVRPPSGPRLGPFTFTLSPHIVCFSSRQGHWNAPAERRKIYLKNFCSGPYEASVTKGRLQSNGPVPHHSGGFQPFLLTCDDLLCAVVPPPRCHGGVGTFFAPSTPRS